ncbi:MAG: hypothetical protein EOO12_00615 [Chitinophagaceae bacterium]|nr:MAG: hypothetical protein EOO12_00615 [Chitinophagaceae bacterium]
MKPSLLLVAVLAFLRVHATDPATSASNVQFPAANIDGGQFNLTFTTGSGNGRIVVIKSGGDITGTPVDGVTYNGSATSSNASLASAAAFTAPNEWVVYRGTSGNITVTGLTPGTTYYVAVFEYSTVGTPNPDYSIVTPTNKFVTTKSAPVTNATITSVNTVTGNSVRVTFTNGSGSGRIVVARKGAFITALPEDLKAYNYNSSFGSSAGSTFVLDAETFVAYKTTSGSQGNTSNADISNLEPNTQYSFAVFEYNGTSSPVYKTPGVSQSVTTNAGPSVAGSGVSFGTIDGNAISMNWGRGNGSRTIVVVKKGSAVANIPVNGQTYTADAAFGTTAAEWVPNSGEYVVSAGTGVSVTVTGLEKFTTYYFAVFSYDADAANNTYYLNTTVHKSQSTALAPTSNRTISATSVTGSTAQLAFGNVNGNNGTYRLMAIRRDDPITWTPQDLVKYNSSTSAYGSGLLVAPGTFLLHSQSNGGAPNISNLTPGHVYYVTCWDLNGTNAPVYGAGSGTQFTIPNEPTAGPSNATFPTIDGNRLRIDWQSGDGAKRIVIIRKGAPVSTLPLDAVDYTADADWGEGSEMGNGLGEYVVYNNSGSSVTVSGLEAGTAYHFAVVEYNVTAGSADYLVTTGSWLAAARATYSAPVTQTNITGTNSISTTGATIAFSLGSGTSRLFVMKAGSAVDVLPADLQVYNATSLFNASGSHMGNGNYAVSNSNSGQFNVTNLQPGVTYHVAAFEFNGSTGPVYLKPAATYSFTTNSVIVAPAAGATAPLVENADGNKLTFRWSPGDGASRIVLARKGAAVDFVPVNGTGYTGNADFSSATDLGSGNRIVYNGAGSFVSITGLEPSVTYHFAVVEFNGFGGTSVYAQGLTLAASGGTATAPASKSSAPVLTPTATTMQLAWSGGSGAGRIVLARAGAAPTADPSDLTKYSADARFGNGPQLAAGEYVVFAGTGNSVTITGLTPGVTYHFKVVEYNGADAPVYLRSDVLTMSAATTAGSLPVSWLYVRGNRQGDRNELQWATAQEQNSDRFVVERALPGGVFMAIGNVAAAGNSMAPRYYSYTDASAPAGLALYRLRQVDSDGRFRYSVTVTLRGNGSGSVRLLQNPVQGALLVDNAAAAGAAWQIADGQGRIVATGTLQGGLQRLATHPLPAGRYLLLVTPRQGAVQSLPFLAP